MTGASSGSVMRKNCRSGPGAVHRRGLVEVLRDLPQPREEDDHRRAELPDRQHDQRPQRIVGMGDPARPDDAERQVRGAG